MLNPVEGVWRVMKEQVGLFNREAFVDGPGAAEERLGSLERLMRDSIDLVTLSLCVRDQQGNDIFWEGTGREEHEGVWDGRIKCRKEESARFF